VVISQTQKGEDGMNRIGGKTKALGLLGYPVEHTLSPLIHNSLAAHYGDDLVYLPFAVAPGQLKEAVRGAYALGIQGLNVTVPHKSEVMQYLREVDPEAKAIGAVNTLVRCEGGYKGYNTDLYGLWEAMRQQGIGLEGEKVLILGAGGAARAVCAMCAVAGAGKVVIVNRTADKAAALAEMTEGLAGKDCEIRAASFEELEKELKGESYLAIQCTSVGLAPRDGECVLSGEREWVFDCIHTGVDLIYKPAETLFLKRLAADGKKTMNGAKMLLYQGVIAYEMFTGIWKGQISTDKQVLEDIFAKMQI